MDKTKEIDIIALAIKVLKQPKPLISFATTFAVIGIIVAVSTPKVFTASVVLAPEMSSGGLGLTESLADMASNFGIDVSSGGKGMDAIYPEIYPEVINSTDFVLNLFNCPIRTKDNNKPRTYYEHITKEAKFPFWQYPKIWISNLFKPKDSITLGVDGKPDPFVISRDNSMICESITKGILCLVDKKTSIITVSISDQDPLTAAIMIDTIQSRLQNYIIQYRTKKAKNDYQYYKNLYLSARAKYQRSQQIYASYCDSNQEITLESFKAKRDELENDMQIDFSTMTQLHSQLLAAEAKIQERTPSFTILSSPKMPYKASSTPRAIIVFLYTIFGVIFDVVWVCVLKDFLRNKNIIVKKDK